MSSSNSRSEKSPPPHRDQQKPCQESFSQLTLKDIPPTVIGNLSRKASLRMLVPINRPSSEPLPLVLGLYQTVKPLDANEPIYFFEEHSVLPQVRPETHDLGRFQVNLIKEKDLTTFRFDNWTILRQCFHQSVLVT